MSASRLPDQGDGKGARRAAVDEEGSESAVDPVLPTPARGPMVMPGWVKETVSEGEGTLRGHLVRIFRHRHSIRLLEVMVLSL